MTGGCGYECSMSILNTFLRHFKKAQRLSCSECEYSRTFRWTGGCKHQSGDGKQSSSSWKRGCGKRSNKRTYTGRRLWWSTPSGGESVNIQFRHIVGELSDSAGHTYKTISVSTIDRAICPLNGFYLQFVADWKKKNSKDCFMKTTFKATSTSSSHSCCDSPQCINSCSLFQPTGWKQQIMRGRAWCWRTCTQTRPQPRWTGSG